MLRVEVSEEGQRALPPIDLDDPSFVIGSSSLARIRLPAEVAELEHVRIEGNHYRVFDGPEGDVGDGIDLEIGTYRVRIAPAPPGAIAATPQRTESLARELMRALLGSGAAPSLEVERGPAVGATRKLAAPESVLVIGRGDEANWIILDEDLSRTHAEVRRGWDGTRLFDLGSKNGSKVDGTPVGRDGLLLRDGVLVELGKIALRFRDPADRQLAATPGTVVASPSARAKSEPAPAPEVSPAPASTTTAPAGAPDADRPSAVPFYAALTIMVAALVGLVWVLSL